MMNKGFLLTGTNLGERSGQLARARELIQVHCGSILLTSSIYETAAWGNTDQPAFLNQALVIETEWNARQLIRKILKTEKFMGRIRKEKFGPRLIDIDILLFNEELHNTRFLKVPHPELHRRRFALVPLAEIAGSQRHPVWGKTVQQLLAECNDPLPVRRYD